MSLLKKRADINFCENRPAKESPSSMGITFLTDLTCINQGSREKGLRQKLILLSGYCSLSKRSPKYHKIGLNRYWFEIFVFQVHISLTFKIRYRFRPISCHLGIFGSIEQYLNSKIKFWRHPFSLFGWLRLLRHFRRSNFDNSTEVWTKRARYAKRDCIKSVLFSVDLSTYFQNLNCNSGRLWETISIDQ